MNPCSPASSPYGTLSKQAVLLSSSRNFSSFGFPRTTLHAEHGALLELEQYFQLIGQDISGAVHSGASQHCQWRWLRG